MGGAFGALNQKKANDYNSTMPIERQKGFIKEFPSLVLCFRYSDSPKYDTDAYQITA